MPKRVAASGTCGSGSLDRGLARNVPRQTPVVRSALAEADYFVGSLCQEDVVRGADHGGVRETGGADEEACYEGGALLVEAGRRLVQEDDVGAAREGSRDCDSLALAGGEAVGGAVDAVGEPEALEPGTGFGLVLGCAAAVVDLLGEQDVLERSGEGHEPRLLAHPAGVVAAVRGQGLSVELGEVDTGDHHRSRVGPLQACDQVQQGGLAGARATLDCYQPPAREVGVETREDLVCAGPVP